MIKLGKLTDYAVVLMGQLAKENDALRSARDLAEKTGVPEPTVAKVLKLLAQGDLVVSLRGATGGYKLARSAVQISVADIITAMEGPIAIVSCVEGSGEDCPVVSTCSMKSHWMPVNSAIKTALEGISLAEMVMPSAVRSDVIYVEMR